MDDVLEVLKKGILQSRHMKELASKTRQFFQIRPKEDYLKLQEKRDVMEWQLDEVLDINGWDLKKTLVQFHKGNATLFEWANSPIVYRITAEWEEIYKSCKRYFSEKVALHHYYGTANSTFQ